MLGVETYFWLSSQFKGDVNMSAIIRNLEKSDANKVARLIPQLTKNIVNHQNLSTWLEQLSEPGQGYWQYVVAERGQGEIVAFSGLVWYPTASMGWIGQIRDSICSMQHNFKGHIIIERELVGNLLQLARNKGLSYVEIATCPDSKNTYKVLGFVDNGNHTMVLKLR